MHSQATTKPAANPYPPYLLQGNKRGERKSGEGKKNWEVACELRMKECRVRDG